MTKDKTIAKAGKRKLMQERQRKQRLTNNLIWAGVGIGVLAIIGWMVWQASQSPQTAEVMGEVIPIASSAHIPDLADPGPYASDPPAGGVHYEDTLPAKFYQESDLASLPRHPEGHLVHNLEHGHVIFWYNCAALAGEGCVQLKDEIQGVLEEFDGVKVVAFPWQSLDVPVVATSWGRLYRFESFDPDVARRFVLGNRNKAPEPDAP
jgi:hypothetical protein